MVGSWTGQQLTRTRLENVVPGGLVPATQCTKVDRSRDGSFLAGGKPDAGETAELEKRPPWSGVPRVDLNHLIALPRTGIGHSDPRYPGEGVIG